MAFFLYSKTLQGLLPAVVIPKGGSPAKGFKQPQQAVDFFVSYIGLQINLHQCWIQKKQCSLTWALFESFCGKGGIRTPGPVKVNGFQDRRIRPLCHLSVCKGTLFFQTDKVFLKLFSNYLYINNKFLLPKAFLSVQTTFVAFKKGFFAPHFFKKKSEHRSVPTYNKNHFKVSSINWFGMIFGILESRFWYKTEEA